VRGLTNVVARCVLRFSLGVTLATAGGPILLGRAIFAAAIRNFARAATPVPNLILFYSVTRITAADSDLA
jgi:hypothetical protein